MPATPTSASAKSSSAIFSERASTVSFYRTRMRSRIATGLATVLLAALLLAGLVAALEGVAALAGITPLAEDAGYVARSRHRRCQFGWDHPRKRCDPSRVARQPGAVIVTLGGSNVIDFYRQGHHFPAVLQRLLDAAAPNAYHVVNMARACKDSTYVRRCAETAAPASPAAFIVYSGHNDHANWGFVNPARRIFLEEHAWYYDWEERLAWSRVFSALVPLIAGGAAGPISIPVEPTGAQLEAGGERILEHFTRNLEAVIALADEIGSEVYLVTLVSNLAEYPVRRSQWDEPLLRAEPSEREARWAERYREGIDAFRAGRFQASLAAFERARDLEPDGRARTGFNQRIRELAARHPHVHLIDLERALHRLGLERGIGCNYFGDGTHCDQFHMNAEVHRLLARMLDRAIRERHPPP
jgi:hypothetical protein